MNNLTSSIKKLESSAKALEPASTAISSSSQYSEQLDKAASQLDELNKLYAVQVKSTESRAGKDTVIRDQMEADVAQLKKQMEYAKLILSKWRLWWNAFCNDKQITKT